MTGAATGSENPCEKSEATRKAQILYGGRRLRPGPEPVLEIKIDVCALGRKRRRDVLGPVAVPASEPGVRPGAARFRVQPLPYNAPSKCTESYERSSYYRTIST